MKEQAVMLYMLCLGINEKVLIFPSLALLTILTMFSQDISNANTNTNKKKICIMEIGDG